MENNPYAPPKAAVADVEPAATDALAFFPVSRTKLVVMSLLTFTLYQLVWFYKNWALERARGTPAMPIMRAIFAVFFCYSLFNRIRRRRNDLPSARLPAGVLAAGWIIVTLLSGVYDRIGMRVEEPALVFLVSLLLGYSSVLFLIPVQNAVDTINRDEAPGHDPNSRFTVWNWLWMILGGVMTLAGLVGTLLPEP
ncbi:MAG TPA: hypothetical protein VKA43_11075 [Gammaproteobacteria bacterium]|nr:hypothetical protein [Gammaproteobacteria bacterium]